MIHCDTSESDPFEHFSVKFYGIRRNHQKVGLCQMFGLASSFFHVNFQLCIRCPVFKTIPVLRFFSNLQSNQRKNQFLSLWLHDKEKKYEVKLIYFLLTGKSDILNINYIISMHSGNYTFNQFQIH